MSGTITSANSVFYLGVTGVFPTAQKLSNYSADDAFSAEDVDSAEVTKGVDNNMAYGWIPYNVPMAIVFQANSDSITLFDQWIAAELAAQEKFPAFGTIRLTAINKKYTLSNGVLQRHKAFPDAKKTLQPITYRLVWDKIEPAPF